MSDGKAFFYHKGDGMNKKIVRWLADELPLWKAKGWMTDENAKELEAYYRPHIANTSPSWGRLLVIALSILLIMAGIFLLFAGYWYSFSPNGRFDWIIVLMVIALTVLGAGIWKTTPASMMADVCTLLYMGIFTTGLLLVADTYYLGESYAFYLLISMVISLPAIYLLQSDLGMIVYLLGIILCCFAPSSISQYSESYMLWILLLAASPFYIKSVTHHHRYTSLVCVSWLYIIAIFSAFFTTVEVYKIQLDVYVIAALSMITYSLGLCIQTKGIWTLPFRTVGLLGLLYTIVKGTLLSTWLEANQIVISASEIVAYIFLAIAVGVCLWQLIKAKLRIPIFIGCLPWLIGLLYILSNQDFSPLTISLLLNVYVMVLAIFMFVHGTIEKHIGYINGSIIAIFGIVGARFFDPSFSFIERGLAFLIIGLFILLINGVYVWRKHIKQSRGRRRDRHSDTMSVVDNASSENEGGSNE